MKGGGREGERKGERKGSNSSGENECTLDRNSGKEKVPPLP